MANATMLDLIADAFAVDADRVLDGPAWLATDRFDVAATAGPDSTTETRRSMLRSLLTERFGLVTRVKSKDFLVKVLTAGAKPLAGIIRLLTKRA
jgi:uncharacterized protein (TIGR03435 family)